MKGLARLVLEIVGPEVFRSTMRSPKHAFVVTEIYARLGKQPNFVSHGTATYEIRRATSKQRNARDIAKKHSYLEKVHNHSSCVNQVSLPRCLLWSLVVICGVRPPFSKVRYAEMTTGRSQLISIGPHVSGPTREFFSSQGQTLLFLILLF